MASPKTTSHDEPAEWEARSLAESNARLSVAYRAMLARLQARLHRELGLPAPAEPLDRPDAGSATV